MNYKTKLLLVLFLLVFLVPLYLIGRDKSLQNLKSDLNQKLDSLVEFQCYEDNSENPKNKECLRWILEELSSDYKIPIIIETNQSPYIEVKLKKERGIAKELLKDILNQLPKKHDMFVKNGILRIREKDLGLEKTYPFTYYKLFEKGVPKKWEDLNIDDDPALKGIIKFSDVDMLISYALKPLRISTTLGGGELPKAQKRKLYKQTKINMEIEPLIEELAICNNSLVWISKWDQKDKEKYFKIWKIKFPKQFAQIKDKHQSFYNCSFYFSHQAREDVIYNRLMRVFANDIAKLSVQLAKKSTGEYEVTLQNNSKTSFAFHNLKQNIIIYAAPDAQQEQKDYSYVIFPLIKGNTNRFTLAPGDIKKLILKLDKSAEVIKLAGRLDYERSGRPRFPTLDEFDNDKKKKPSPKLMKYSDIQHKKLKFSPILFFYSSDLKKTMKAKGEAVSY